MANKDNNQKLLRLRLIIVFGLHDVSGVLSITGVQIDARCTHVGWILICGNSSVCRTFYGVLIGIVFTDIYPVLSTLRPSRGWL